MDLHNRCNLRCTMCFFSIDEMWRTPKVEMSEALIEKIVADVWPLTRELWLSCATEPLIGKRLEDLLPRAKASGIPSVRMVTNGLALNERKVKVILDGGLDGLDVSVDGATPETYEAIRRGSNFEKVVDNLKRLRDLKRERGVSRPTVNVIAVMMPENLAEWPDLVHLAADVGADSIGLVPLVEIAELPREQHLSSLAGEVNDSLARAHDVARLRSICLNAPQPFSNIEPDTGAPPGAPSEPRVKRCFVPWVELMIDAAGEVTPCPNMLGKKSFGNLRKQSFREIYYGRPFRSLRDELRRGELNPVCQACAGLKRDTLDDPAIFEQRHALRERDGLAKGT